MARLAILALVAASAAFASAQGAPPPEAPALESEEDFVKEAKRLYARREVSFKGKNIDACIEVLEQGIAKYPKSFDLHWRLSQAYFWKSDATDDEDTKSAYGKKSKDVGDIAREVKPKDVRGHYFSAIGTGAWAEGMGLLSAISNGVEGKFRQRLDKSVELNQKFDCGGPQITMGRYYFNLPWPKYDGDKSIEWLEKAVKTCPTSARAHAYLAEALWKEDEEDRAKKHLDTALGIDPKKCFSPPECRRAQKQAKRLVKEFD